MFPRITDVRYLHGYNLELTFSNGSVGTIDLQNYVVGKGGVFAPLKDLLFFQQVKVDAEAGTLVWPNGVDLCPDVLYSLATGTPLPDFGKHAAA
jgi:hypothetical protein